MPTAAAWISDLILNNVVYAEYFDHFVTNTFSKLLINKSTPFILILLRISSLDGLMTFLNCLQKEDLSHIL